MTSLIKVEGIGKVYAGQLRKVGITTTEGLLERGSTPKGRQEIAVQSSISENLILEWVNRSDLFRVRGIGEEYSDLLESAGVDTVVELAQRNPQHLYDTLVKVNQNKKLVPKLPTAAQVAAWVIHAKELPRAVAY